ncbi:Uncharacterised protein [Yersinia bercovieri]|uniref:hypothetical protein n=1 Tax=Yersinia bercovieri TaxID=634 RepID=UPI00061C6710|nr:hypothetical protein [Yersinia bercovieri]CNE76185.1 Uncharacterised protein [Yersinia bercovieri]
MINNDHYSINTKSETIELEGKLENNKFEVDLRQRNYIISNADGTATLTFKNSKKENLVYIPGENCSYLLDKESGHKVTFSNAGYAGYNQALANLQEAADEIEHALFNNYDLTIDGDGDIYRDAITANKHYNKVINDSNFTHQILYQNYNEGDIPTELILHKINNVIEVVDIKIRILISKQNEKIDNLNAMKDEITNYNKLLHDINNNIDSKRIDRLNAEKKAFSNYKNLLHDLNNHIVDNQMTGIKEMIIENVTYDSKKFITSNKTNSLQVNSLDDYFDYTNNESECINPEGYPYDVMAEYISEFSDQMQSSGVQCEVPPFDTGNLPTIAMIH